MQKKTLISVLTFFVLAVILTFLINQFPPVHIWKIDITPILCGFGPLLSGMLCYQLFKTENVHQVNFNGLRPGITYGILGVAVLLPLLFINRLSKEAVLISILTQFVYSFGEEFGWRHYLQNATAGINKFVKPILIGTIWFAWHFSFIGNPIKVISGQDMPIVAGIPFCILILSILAFLWGDLVIKTKSILIPTIAHSITKFGDLYSVGIVLTLLLLLQIFWKKFNPDGKKKLFAEHI